MYLAPPEQLVLNLQTIPVELEILEIDGPSLRKIGLGICIAIVTLPGCERKEKVLDIETPAGEIEVERSPDSDSIDIEINK